MIKFKEHDGLIFKMLEEPVPLTPDAEVPCLVRFRMPFLERFRGKHEEMAYFCDAIKKNQLYGNRLYAYETRRVGCVAEPRELEIIGYPVADGSKEWALYQMMQGKMVCHKTSRWDWYRMYSDHAIQNRTAGCMPRVSAWLESTVQSGWEIYKEPKPLLAEAKVGDLCKRRDGKYVQVDSYSNDRPCPVMCKSDIGGQDCFTLDGRNHNAVNNDKDIISTEPLAPKGTAEWALQMMRLGNKVRNRDWDGGIHEKSLLYCQLIGETIKYNEGCSAFDVCLSDWEAPYIKNTGWQIYEPELKYKVGDYLEVDENGKIVHCYIVPKSEANQEISGLLYDLSTPKRWVGCIYRNKPNTHIIRKLKPSEVQIKIGCLSGTIAKSFNPNYFLMLHSRPMTDCNHSMIRFSALDTETRSLVESLLKAMRGES